MRARHTAHKIPAFPIYSSAFLGPNEVVLGGGGGSSKSGIKNKLKLYRIEEQNTLTLIDELELGAGEDAPMSMAANIQDSSVACGVNSAEDVLLTGRNENCRVFSAKDNKLALLRTQGTLNSNDLEDYQKVTVISPGGSLVAVAGANTFHLLSYPSLVPVASSISTEDEIYDVTFSETTVVVVTVASLLVYALPSAVDQTSSSPSKKKKKKKTASVSKVVPELELLRTVEIPDAVGGPGGGKFRSAKYHPTDSRVLYTAINSSPVRTRKSKTASRKAFLCKWNTDSWTVEQVRKVGERGLTCFTVSPDGKVLAFGNSDLMVGLLESRTLNPVLTILKAHEFPPTTLAFSPTSGILVSGSADSLRVVWVPEALGGWSWSFIIMVILALLAVLLALGAQQYSDRFALQW